MQAGTVSSAESFEGTKECIGNYLIPKKIRNVAAQKQVQILDVSTVLSHDEMDGHVRFLELQARLYLVAPL